MRVMAFGVISSIAGASYQDFYLQCLGTSKMREKWAVMPAVRRHCGPEAVDAVVKRARRLMGRSNKNLGATESELTEALEYLHQYCHDRCGGVHTVCHIRYPSPREPLFRVPPTTGKVALRI